MSQVAELKFPQCKYCNDTPFLIAATVGRGLGDGYTMTTTVKASYSLVPGHPLVPMETQVQFRGDEWPGEDFRGALRHGTDLVMWKPRCDVLLRATCHAPGGLPATEVQAAFAVGEWHKEVLVIGDRTWKVGFLNRTPGAPQPFTTMPLDWEHAYGGADFPDNPAGKGFRADLLPNVEYADRRLRSYGSTSPPAAFLPVNRMWAKRMGKMGSADGSYLTKRFPLPPGDFDWGYLNEAPEDQQLEHYLRGDEEITFVNLHAQQPDWSVQLPGMRIRCFVADTDERDQPRTREVEMNCDTLFANLEEGYLHLLWRGLLPIRSESRSEVTKFYVVEEPIAGPAKPLEQHLADMEQARDLGEKLADQVNAEVDMVKNKASGILARYGLKMPAARVAPGPTATELACLPFNPNGPLPPSAAKFQDAIDQLGRLRSQAMERFRALGKEHGVDVDASPKGGLVDLLAMYKKGVKDSIALLEEKKAPVPDSLKDQLAKLETPGGDPIGVVAVSQAFKKAGLDIASRGDPVSVALANGDTAGFLAAIQQLPSAPADHPVPGASPAASGGSLTMPGPGSPGPASPGGPVPSAGVPELAGGIPLPEVGNAAGQPPLGIADGPQQPAKPGPRPAGGLSREDARRMLAGGAPLRGRNFYAADFSGLDLSGRDFTQSQCMHASFRGANLTGCTFASVLMRQADFSGADLRGAKLGFGDYTQADFSEARLSGVDLERVVFASCHFVRADLHGASLTSVIMDGCDLSWVDLGDTVITEGIWQDCIMRSAKAQGSTWTKVLLSGSLLDDGDYSRSSIHDTILMSCRAQRLVLAGGHLKGMRAFNGTDLQGAKMVGAMMCDTSWMFVRLDDADFSQGDLRGANLMFSSAIKAHFAHADLKGAKLRHTRLEAADFHGANLCQASFGNADLSLADLRSSNCYQTDFQDAVTANAQFDGANLTRSSLRRG